jgi:hypothetical protein
MANGDQYDVRGPMGDRVNVAEMDSDDNDDDDDDDDDIHHIDAEWERWAAGLQRERDEEMRRIETNDRDIEAESHDEYDDDDDDDEEDDDEEESEGDEIDIENVEKFIRTFHNGDYDTEFDDALSFDRGVVFPARLELASYSKPDNWRERNRIGLDRVKEQLDSFCGYELLLIHYNTDHNQEPIVWYEPILDEYWDEVEARISKEEEEDEEEEEEEDDEEEEEEEEEETGDKIRSIRFKNVEITKGRLATLVSALSEKANAINDVSFNNANLCEEGIVCLSKLVDVSSNLQEFCLQHNRIDNIESARCLSRSLKSHTGINHLDLSLCDLGSNPEILSVVLQSDIRSIYLSNNNIDSLGAVIIAEYLEGDPPIHDINLDDNQLNDDDALLISHALKRNSNLRHLGLLGNNFSSSGVKALLTCAFDASSLNAISESNHTLTSIDIIQNQNQYDKLACCIEMLIRFIRTSKIMIALQDKDSLLQYLANLPVELIPEVLAFHHGLVDDEYQYKHLNIVYSTM